MSKGTERMTMGELAASGGLANLRSSATGTPLRAIAEAAIAAQEKAQGEAKPAAAAPTKGEDSQKAPKRKSEAIKTPTEYEEQVDLFAWADRMVFELPELDLLFATINGAKMPYGKNKNGQRFSKEAVRQKKAGLKNGIPDLILLVARRDYHGLLIELKRAKKSLSVVSDEQKQWIEKLTARGYLAVICYGAEEAKKVILNYLGAE